MNTEIKADSLVILTESAAREIKSMVSRQKEHEGKPLRVYIEGGGCSGLQYGMIFDDRRDGDIASEFHGVSVVVDADSASYLRGAVIDFSEEMMGGGFKIQNPNAHKSCGCGKSFEA
jgi:iron-sulfur cluster assembly accessory protein